jgi:hypothetical protein
MTLKRLLLASLVSAGSCVFGSSGAGAADAVVVAEPEPVEYVRICDVYGEGYYYIPGTETCLRVGGYVRYQFAGGDLWAREAVDHLDGDVNDAWDQYSRLSLQTLTGTETELGTLRTFTETRFEFANGGPGTDVSLNFAWIELGGFRVGKDESAYSVYLNYASGVIADDLIPYGPFDTNLISYTFTSGAFSAMVALEEGSESYGHDYTIDSYVPHVVAGAKLTQDWGGVGIVGGYDSVHEVFAVKGRLDIKATENISAFLMAGWGEDDAEFDFDSGDAGSYNFYKPWAGSWAIFGGLTAKVSDKATINAQVSYDDGEELAAALNVAYELVPGLVLTPEVDYLDTGEDDALGGIMRFERSF